MSEIKERLHETIADVLGIGLEDVQEGLDKKSCEAWDSFNHIVLMDEIERTLEIKITLEESERIDSYADLCRLLTERGAL